jgi:streptomycin 6-kinase
MRSSIHIPSRLTATCLNRPEHAAWLARLPEILTQLGRRWSLTFGTPFDSGEASCSWVAPVELAGGTPAVVKVGLPHMESEDEIEGLRFWDGNPMVRLLRADDESGAMLLERCEPGTALRTVPAPDQDVVIARLLRRAWRPPGASHAFRPLSAMLATWSDETLAAAGRWPDPGLVREGLRLFRELPRSASHDVVLVTDLHAGNVLRARREPWLAIDPKPFVGDPAYDATQHLLNCEARLRSDPHGTIKRFADLLSVDHERVRLWLFARVAAGPRDDWTEDWTMELARATAP